MNDSVSRKAILNVIETKRLQLIEWDDDSGADMLEMWIDEIERGDFYIPSTESEGEAHRHASQIVIDRLNDEIGIQALIIANLAKLLREAGVMEEWISKALEGSTSETAVQPTGWIDGPPPEFEGEDEVLIVAELPSLFSGVNVVAYMCSQWLGASWSRNEVYRASRWMRVPLPGIKDGREGT